MLTFFVYNNNIDLNYFFIMKNILKKKYIIFMICSV